MPNYSTRVGNVEIISISDGTFRPPLANVFPKVTDKEFEDYQSSNYNTIAVLCLCWNDNSYIISTVDREGWEYPLVICRSCGLIRAKNSWDEKNVIHILFKDEKKY